MVAEFFASNPIHGDNENDTYFVADLVNNAAQVREGVAKLVSVLKDISEWAGHGDEPFAAVTWKMIQDAHTVLAELGYGE